MATENFASLIESQLKPAAGAMYASGVAMRWSWCVVVLLITMAASTAFGQQAVHQFTWRVQYHKMKVDCNASVPPKDVLGVIQTFPVDIPFNFPGPTVRARQGDRIEVTVTNNISKVNPYGPPERLSLHWHGIRQRGTPWSDGAAGLTESGIPRGKTRLYNFTVDRAGTYFYHGHSGAQRAAGLFGLLIVEERIGAVTPSYDGIFEVGLVDWWNSADIYDQVHGLQSSSNWKWVGNPSSLLIKGASSPCPDPLTCPVAELHCDTRQLQPLDSSMGGTGAGTLIWNVRAGKTYLVRIVSATSTSYLNFLIQDHELTMIEADGHLIQNFSTSSLDILPGQSYTVSFTTKADYPDQRVYWIGVNARDRTPDSRSEGGTDPGFAILSYSLPYVNRTVNFPPTEVTSLWSTEPQLQTGGPRWNNSWFGPWFASQIKARPGRSYPVPMRDDRSFSFLIRQIKVVDEAGFRMRWTMNNLSYDTATDGTFLLEKLAFHSGLYEPLTGSDTVDFKALNQSDVTGNRMENRGVEAIQSGYYSLRFGEIVTVVLQNTAMYNSTSSETHPFHLHLHDMWVIGSGSGLYDPETSPASFNLIDPPVRNTATLPALGWVAIRFIADNRGVFSLHCHNEFHQVDMGMLVIFAVDVEGLDSKQIVERY